MMTAILLFSTLVTASPAAAAKGVEHWDVVSNHGGVAVWSRDIPGTTVREVKADMVIDAAPETVYSVLRDVGAYSSFMPNVVYARVLTDLSEHQRIEYRRIKQPQISTYDVVLDVTSQSDGDHAFSIHWSCVANGGPAPRADSVRMSECEGSWAIEATAEGQTHIMYWNYADPGGSIPSFLVDLAETRALPDMMRHLAKRVATTRAPL